MERSKYADELRRKNELRATISRIRNKRTTYLYKRSETGKTDDEDVPRGLHELIPPATSKIRKRKRWLDSTTD